MRIFLDTANLDDVKKYKNFIDGVTTNPSIMSKYNHEEHETIIKKLCEMVDGHVSVEVVSNTYESMLNEGRALSKISEQICVKLPCTMDGMMVCKTLSDSGISTNMTLCFSAAQAIFAAKCGATYVSPFIGRLDDAGEDGIGLIEEICSIYNGYGFETMVLAASVRNINHFIQSAMVGSDAITLSSKILHSCLGHSMTDAGLDIFSKDWEKSKK